MKNDIQEMPNRKLAALLRQAGKPRSVDCRYGHAGCGCSTARNMDGRAHCSNEIAAEVQRRADEQNTEEPISQELCELACVDVQRVEVGSEPLSDGSRAWSVFVFDRNDGRVQLHATSEESAKHLGLAIELALRDYCV